MAIDTKEPENMEATGEEVPKHYRRCQRQTHCHGNKAMVQCWDGMEPIMVCRACMTEAEAQCVDNGPYEDPCPPAQPERIEG